MKKLLFASVLLLGCANWMACKKSDKSTPDPVLPEGMFATINGTAWAGSSQSVTSITGGPEYLDYYAYDTSGKTIDLRIYNFRTRGTYNVPEHNDSIFYSTDTGLLAAPVAATSGTIKIEVVNDTAVGGTFSFTASGLTVTNGTFQTIF